MSELKKSGSYEINFCAECGSDEIEKKKIDGRERSICQNCGRVFYRNPIPSVVGISIINEEILLVKRGIEPDIGTWCLPGGFMELGETTEEAVIRELYEEIGLKVKPGEIITIDTTIGGFYGDVVVIAYGIELESKDFIAGDDALEVRYFPYDKLPNLTFYSHKLIIDRAFDKIKAKIN